MLVAITVAAACIILILALGGMLKGLRSATPSTRIWPAGRTTPGPAVPNYLSSVEIGVLKDLGYTIA